MTEIQQGRGGMGSHKHYASGRASRSPRYKLTRTRDDSKRREEKNKRRPKPKMVSSFEELFGKR